MKKTTEKSTQLLKKEADKPKQNGGARAGSGRKPFLPTDAERKQVEAMSGYGVPFEQIANAHMYYNQLCSDKESMKGITLNKRKQAQLLGILFAEYQILTTEQASIVRQQMDRPSHVYADSNSLWAFYNYVTIALQHSHPKTGRPAYFVPQSHLIMG